MNEHCLAGNSFSEGDNGSLIVGSVAPRFKFNTNGINGAGGPARGGPPDGQGSIVWEGALSVKGAGSRYVAEVGGSDLHLKTPDFSTFIIQTLTPP